MLESSSDKEEPDVEVEHSMLGLQSHWDSAYAEELANFHEHGDAGEVWCVRFYLPVIFVYSGFRNCIDVYCHYV